MLRTEGPAAQRQDIRIPMRLRRKFVRFSGGSARSRRIWSRSSSSLSFLRALSAALRATRGFRKSLLQDRQHGLIPRPARGLLAFDDISQDRYAQRALPKSHYQCASA